MTSQSQSAATGSKCLCRMDARLLDDERVLANLLRLEDSYTTSNSYLTHSSSSYSSSNGQTKIRPSMRHALATWMLEVCEDENCTDHIFALSMNLFDRCMAAFTPGTIGKQHIQLLGSVCLFIASKLKSSSGHKLTAYKLVEYTDNSITLDELIDWELIVLDKLRWDVAPVLSNDYVELLVHRLDHLDIADEAQLTLLKRHCYAFTALCATDSQLAFQPPSLIASACLLASLAGIGAQLGHTPAMQLHKQMSVCNMLYMCTSIDIECLLTLKDAVDELFKRSFAKPQQQPAHHQHVSNSTLLEEDEAYNGDNDNNDDDDDDAFNIVDDYDLAMELSVDKHNANSNEYDQLNDIEQFFGIANGLIDDDSTSSSASAIVYHHHQQQQQQLQQLQQMNPNSLHKRIDKLSLDQHNRKQTSAAYETTQQQQSKRNTRKTRHSNSSVESASSFNSSSGVSSMTTATSSSQLLLLPPHANLLPMPEFGSMTAVTSSVCVWTILCIPLIIREFIILCSVLMCTNCVYFRYMYIFSFGLG